MSLCLLQFKGRTKVTTKLYFPFLLGAHHSSHVDFCPVELSELHHVRVSTACFWSRAGDGLQRAVFLKKQRLCLSGRAKCCSFPDAFLERGQGKQLHVIHAVTETGRGAAFRGNEHAHSGLGTWRYFLSLTKRNSVSFTGWHLLQTSTVLCVDDSISYSFTWSSKV